MKIFFIIVSLFMLNFELFADGKLENSCFDIHKIIKYTDIYRYNLSFNHDLIYKGSDFEIFNDYIYIHESESKILERIKNDTNNFIRDEIGLDSTEIGMKNYYNLYELSQTVDSLSTTKTLFFKVHFNEFIIFVEVYIREISEEFTLHFLLKEILRQKDLNGFDISYFNSINKYYLFKCVPSNNLIFLGTYFEANLH